MQIERILEINNLRTVTKEVVEKAPNAPSAGVLIVYLKISHR